MLQSLPESVTAMWATFVAIMHAFTEQTALVSTAHLIPIAPAMKVVVTVNAFLALTVLDLPVPRTLIVDFMNIAVMVHVRMIQTVIMILLP